MSCLNNSRVGEYNGEINIDLKSMYRKLSLSTLSLAGLAFAASPNAEMWQKASDAAVNQWIKMIPLFIVAFGISVFFSLIRKNPQKAIIGCSGFVGVAFVIGLVVWLLEFISAHFFVFLLIAIGLFFVGLVLFMIYSPPSPPKVHDEYDPQEDKNNPFYEGPR